MQSIIAATGSWMVTMKEGVEASTVKQNLTIDTNMVITPHDRNWHSVRLKDDTSITYLNGLLKEGWYVVEAGVSGLPALAFRVPLEPPTATSLRWQNRNRNQIPREEIVVLILHKGSVPDRQKVLVNHRNEDGYLEMGKLKIETGWRSVITLEIESGTAIAIVERSAAG